MGNFLLFICSSILKQPECVKNDPVLSFKEFPATEQRFVASELSTALTCGFEELCVGHSMITMCHYYDNNILGMSCEDFIHTLFTPVSFWIFRWPSWKSKADILLQVRTRPRISSSL